MADRDYSTQIEDSNLLYYREFRDMEFEESKAAPLTEKEEFELISKYTPRIDGAKIVTGKADFTQDIKLRGMLCGKILRSPHACAEILSVDLSEALNHPGVKAALQLKKGRIKYAGEQVAAVAAVDEKTAEEAIKLIRVDYRVLPHVVSEESALEKDAPRVYGGENVQKFSEYSRGDVEKGFRGADVVLERTYRTAVEIHHPAETHSSVARWEGERLTVWDSTQAIFSVRDGLAQALNIPASRIKVINHYMGGGFGSKLGVNDYTITAALLAKKTNRPVKIVLSRKENSVCVGNRPSSRQTIKAGVKKDGTLTALVMTNYTCGGIGRGDRCSEQLIDLYKCPNVKVEEFTVYTHTGASRPTRAPGFPQGALALEGMMDEIANEIGIDPLELRRINYSQKNRGETEIPYSSKGLDKCYTSGAELIGWQRRNKKPGSGRGRKRRGIGMASGMWWGIGRPGTMAEIKIHRDASIETVCGTQDLGTGTRTHMAVVTAETLGLKPEEITVKIGNTDYPWCGSSGGSTTTPSVAPAVRDAALKTADYLKKEAARSLNIEPSEVKIKDGKFLNTKIPEQSITFKQLISSMRLRRELVFHGECGGRAQGFAYNTFGAHFAEVEVDIETGRVRVLKIVAAHDSGRIINKQTAESQVVGGIIQGLSTALFEERLMDENTGKMVNSDLENYKIATSCDAPEIIPVFVDIVDPYMNILGAKGLGEPPRVPPAAAIANAVYNAVGVHVREIPMTPAKVVQALKRKEGAR